MHMESYYVYSFMSCFFHIRFVRFISVAACSYSSFIFIAAYYSLDGHTEIYPTIWHQIVVIRILVLHLKIRAGIAALWCLSTTITTTLHISSLTPYKQTKSSKNHKEFHPASLLKLHLGAEETTPLSCKEIHWRRGFYYHQHQAQCWLYWGLSHHDWKGFGINRLARYSWEVLRRLKECFSKRYLLQCY